MSRNSNNTTPLCLACSSSLPPRLWKWSRGGAQSGGTSSGASDSARRPSSELFLTRCCDRPICPSCLASNPRLARYNPCLACLSGIGALGSEKVRGQHQVVPNVDGAVRDEDVFVVGEEDEDEVPEMDDGEAARARAIEVTSPLSEASVTVEPCADPNKSNEPPDSDQGSSGRYYIRPDDTLLGISLRLGVDGRTLCKLNDLPPSTLRTTPHLLHTRTFLVLPQSRSQRHAMSEAGGVSVPLEEAAERTRAHAEVAFQHVTKETDHGIARAYVALAEDSDSGPDVTYFKEAKREKESSQRWKTTLEERAVDRYLDDDEWERRERAEGRGVHIQRLPFGRGNWGKMGQKAKKGG